MGKKVPLTVIRRLPRYFRYINELLKNDNQKISSRELGLKMSVTASQIRQDLNHFGGFGQQGYGYNVSQLNDELSSVLGVDMGYKAIIVGMGNLGNAIAKNINFGKRGIKLIGLFDNNVEKIGLEYGGLSISDVKYIEEFCKKNKPDIAVLTLPKVETPKMYEQLKALGVKGFWNFSNMELKEDKNTIIENVHIADSLMVLSYMLKNKQ